METEQLDLIKKTCFADATNEQVFAFMNACQNVRINDSFAYPKAIDEPIAYVNTRGQAVLADIAARKRRHFLRCSAAVLFGVVGFVTVCIACA